MRRKLRRYTRGTLKLALEREFLLSRRLGARFIERLAGNSEELRQYILCVEHAAHLLNRTDSILPYCSHRSREY